MTEENKLKKIDMSTMTTLTNEVEKIDDMARDFSHSLNNLFYEIVPVIRQLVNERNDRIDEIRDATEPTGDFACSLATLMTKVDELENAIDECYLVSGDHEERINDLMGDIESIERRLDDAEVNITI